MTFVVKADTMRRRFPAHFRFRKPIGKLYFCSNNKWRIILDPAKRPLTLDQRGRDFADAGKVFDGAHLTIEDDRLDYGETRYFTVGFLDERMIVLVWTPRGDDQRIISMRKANDREQKAYGARLGGH